MIISKISKATRMRSILVSQPNITRVAFYVPPFHDLPIIRADTDMAEFHVRLTWEELDKLHRMAELERSK